MDRRKSTSSVSDDGYAVHSVSLSETIADGNTAPLEAPSEAAVYRADKQPGGNGSVATPLVIDLDSTLISTNLLFECIIAFIKHHPLGIFRLIGWLLRGRAFLKQEVARHVRLDIASIPINAAVEAYAVGEKARGRRIYLATAADSSLARSIADRCGFFDGVLASDGQTNLKGRFKLEALKQSFPSGFAYAGDSRADVPIWAHANEVIVVGPAAWARRVTSQFSKPVRIFPAPSQLRAVIKCARPHQWAKNVLVFVPAILSAAIRDPHVVLTTTLSFVALCLTSSATYIVNDIWDLADDRRHWSKCNRPLASGSLSIETALAIVPMILLPGLLLATLAAPMAGIVLGCYLLLTLSYSFALKRIPVLDVTVLAGLFTIRLVLGIVTAGVAASPWLLVFAMFLFSALCFAKRYVEVERSIGKGQTTFTSRGYHAKDHMLIFALGCCTAVASIVMMVLYIIFDAFQQTFFGNTEWLWAFPLILYLWLGRVWLLAMRGELDDDPVAFAVKDVPSLLLGSAMMIAFILAWSGAII